MAASSLSETPSVLTVVIGTSMTTWLLVLCALVLLLVVVVIGINTSTSTTTSVQPVVDHAPGPTGMAGLKFMLSIRKGASRRVFNAAMTYGKTFRVGDTNLMMMDYKHVEEAFVTKGDIFSDRGGIVRKMMACIPDPGSISENGPAWREVREFVGSTVKNADYGRDNIDRCIDLAVPQLISTIDGRNDEAHDPKFTYQLFFVDVLHRLAFGVGIDYGDAAVRTFVEKITDAVVQTLNPALSVLALPSISAGFLYTGYRAKLKSAANYVKARADEALTRREASAVSPSLVALFAGYIERLRSAGASTSSEPNDGWRLIFDFYFAASETVHEVLLWATLLLATHQNVQEKMRQEIATVTMVTGHAKCKLGYEDRHLLPFIRATMLEILRARPVAPLGVPHFASEDGCVGSHTVSKGTQLFSNLWGMHHDPDVWSQPARFNPDRFMTAAGKVDEAKAKLVIPFSVGARSCPGEHIARRTIFRTLVALVSRYQLTLPSDGPRPSLVDEENAFTMVPDRFKAVFSNARLDRESDIELINI